VSNEILREEILQFGDDARLFGIMTLPSLPLHQTQKLPVFVFLSCGVLHRVGPLRLYVRLARTLAQMGFSSLRVDLTGRGDSPGRPELRNEKSLMADYKEIVSILEARLGQSQLVLGGLCSGADNALMLAQANQRVIGLLLMDPTVYPDDGFRVRQFFRILTNPARYMNPANYVLKLKLNFERLTEPPEVIGNPPTRERLRAAFQAICERKGRALSVFTSSWERQGYCNQLGQLGRTNYLPGYEQYCTERFFSTAGHTFDLELHRRRLLDEVKVWAAGYL
jgi:pimeloyl-ACP methyl ester carboxylesterase